MSKMKRKVLKVGNVSLAVSLPSKWAKQHGLKAGDELEIGEQFDNLIVGSAKELSQEEIAVSITKGTVSFLRTIISNAYKKGYDIVRVTYESAEVGIKLQKIVDGLIGFEIIDQHEGRCLIKNIAQGLESEYETFLKKSFFMTLSVADISYEDFKAKKYDRFEEVQQIKDNVTKYTNFVKRLINKKRRAARTMIFEYLTVWCLEKIINEYLYSYRYLSRYDKKGLNKRTLEFFKRTNDKLRLFYEGFYEKDNQKIQRVTDLKDQYLYKDLYELFHAVKDKDSAVVHHLANIIRRTYDMAGPYFGINL